MEENWRDQEEGSASDDYAQPQQRGKEFQEWIKTAAYGRI